MDGDDTYILMEHLGDREYTAGMAVRVTTPVLIGRNVYGICNDERHMKFVRVTVAVQAQRHGCPNVVRLGTLTSNHMTVELFTAVEFAVLDVDEVRTIDNRFWWVDEHTVPVVKKILDGSFSPDDALDLDTTDRRVNDMLLKTLVHSDMAEATRIIQDAHPVMFRHFVNTNLNDMVYYPLRIVRQLMLDNIARSHRLGVLESLLHTIPEARAYHGTRLAIIMLKHFKEYYTMPDNSDGLNHLVRGLYIKYRWSGDDLPDYTAREDELPPEVCYKITLLMLKQHAKRLSEIFLPNLIAVANRGRLRRGLTKAIREFL